MAAQPALQGTSLEFLNFFKSTYYHLWLLEGYCQSSPRAERMRAAQQHSVLSGGMERVKGVEPSSSAWKADIMPLYDARKWSSCLGSNQHLTIISRRH